MENTERVVALSLEHLAGCLALSKSAHWNQNEADWRLMLGFGRGWGVVRNDGALAASTLALPYGEDLAWVAMVLVLPEHRRMGYASRLLRLALDELNKQGRTPILDATPAGRAVYVQEGFKDTWGFKRFFHPGKVDVAGEAGARTIAKADWPRLLELDRQAFGADREVVLRDLARRQPRLALTNAAGFVLGREGREATQIGPLVARDKAGAAELLAAALTAATGPVYLDLQDGRAGLEPILAARGFSFQRPFTRMVHMPGTPRAPGDAALVFCPAGPELG